MTSTLDTNKDSSNYFAVQRRAFELLGFKLPGVGKELRFRLGHPVWAAVVLFSIISHILPMLVETLWHASDLIHVTDLLANVNQSSLSTFKVTMFIIKRRHVSALLARLHGLNEREMSTPGESRELIARENQLDARLCSILRNGTYGTVLISAVMPLAAGLSALLLRGSFEPRTPLEFSFWLDTTLWIYYWPVYVWGVFATASVALVVISVDTLFLWLVRNIVIQFELLARQLRKSCSTSEQLEQCVKLHCVALELAQQLNDIYAEIGFVQYTLSYLQVCTLTYRFSRGGWSPELPFRAAFLLVVLAQLSAYCFGGEHIKQQSLRIADEIYASYAWQTVPPRSRRTLQLMMLRAQRPAKVTGFMFSIDRPLLMWVSKAIERGGEAEEREIEMGILNVTLNCIAL